jgi:hypothetical protein
MSGNKPAPKATTEPTNSKKKDERVWDGYGGSKKDLDRSKKSDDNNEQVIKPIVVGETKIDAPWLREEEETQSTGVFGSFLSNITGNKVIIYRILS